MADGKIDNNEHKKTTLCGKMTKKSRPAVAGAIVGTRLGLTDHSEDNRRVFALKLDDEDRSRRACFCLLCLSTRTYIARARFISCMLVCFFSFWIRRVCVGFILCPALPFKGLAESLVFELRLLECDLTTVGCFASSDDGEEYSR